MQDEGFSAALTNSLHHPGNAADPAARPSDRALELNPSVSRLLLPCNVVIEATEAGTMSTPSTIV